MKRKTFTFICILLAITLFLPISVESKGGGKKSSGKSHSSTKGGHYVGSRGSGHKGSHYSNPKTGNHYTKRSSSPRSGSKASSVKRQKIHTATSKVNYHSSVKRDSHGKIVRSQAAKQQFLRNQGMRKVPKGYEVDHKVPLYAGGSDTPGNMQLLNKAQHNAKTKADYQKYGR
jgi:5-methylcytosine-specific restriction endonuclease McrA